MGSPIIGDAPSLRESARLRLNDLLARVEAATGRDFELEREIALAVGWTFAVNDLDPADPDYEEFWTDPDGVELSFFDEPEWSGCTSSLDAALAMVQRALPGVRVCITHAPPTYCAAELLSGRNRKERHLGGCERPDGDGALAVIYALLEAVQAHESLGNRKDGSSPKNPDPPS